jgi:hypothetical protein
MSLNMIVFKLKYIYFEQICSCCFLEIYRIKNNVAIVTGSVRSIEQNDLICWYRSSFQIRGRWNFGLIIYSLNTFET